MHISKVFCSFYLCSNMKLDDVKKPKPASNYTFKVNNRNTRTRCEICSKLTRKTPERCRWRGSGVFMFNFEHILHLALVFLLLLFEQANTGWKSLLDLI